MKAPSERERPIDGKRVGQWLQDFSGYRHSIPEGRIHNWLSQYDKYDQDLAARLLDSVDFINSEQIRTAFRTALSALPGWNRSARLRKGTWRFAAYSSSAGESGDSMLHVFRQANNLASSSYNKFFVYQSELVREKLGAEDSVVLVDDMVGSGNQVCNAWESHFGEILAGVGNVYLVVVAASIGAAERIADKTSLSLRSSILLTHADNVFSEKCKHFSKAEKERILHYCSKACSKEPKGHDDSGLVLVFSHTIPNNSLPILHKKSAQWEPLFRRYD